jgi:hypothetical protein
MKISGQAENAESKTAPIPRLIERSTGSQSPGIFEITALKTFNGVAHNQFQCRLAHLANYDLEWSLTARNF